GSAVFIHHPSIHPNCKLAVQVTSLLQISRANELPGCWLHRAAVSGVVVVWRQR
ncbi:hypothetical protein V5799_003752, partial [Amblyomma americanum]